MSFNQSNTNGKSLESWLWEAACSIRGEIEAPKYKDFIIPLVFLKRLNDVFEDELFRITQTQLMLAVGYKQEEIDAMNLGELSPEETQNLLRKKLLGAQTNNGHKQKVVSTGEIKHYVEDLGWEYVKDINPREAIVRLPER